MTSACTQAIVKDVTIKEEFSALSPKGVISLEYPNQWDINKLIALSNDGSRLIDASEDARYIRVWDWENKKVVQRLLLNEKAPEMNDGKDRAEMVLQSSLGQELALSQDGRMVAACVSIERNMASGSSHSITRVWNLENGEIAVDNIASPMRHVPGLDQDAILLLNCRSISFSPDGRYMAVLVDASQYANETDFDAKSANFNPRTGKYKEGKRPVGLSGIALFETHDWKLERFFYRPRLQQMFNSRPLFDSESKTVSAVLFDRPPIKVNDSLWNRKWVGNRIARWDIATGVQLEERDVPQLANSPYSGVWWTALPGGREVWWQNGFHQSNTVNDERTLYQTTGSAEQCRLSPVLEPTFESDVISNCAYIWVLSVLNLDTGKIKYLAPFKKNPSPATGTQEQFYWAKISPDGVHIVLFHKTENTRNRLQASSSVEVRSMETWQLEGRYSDNIRFEMETVFSSDSRYFALPINKSRNWVKSAVIFELPKNKLR